ncbi:unnamed protein product [Candidula unifasciata]|uniref:RING-type domain-containing protein n=1 Tax=Candidula unifasciata TaxID=100452 RepID=A0A8S3YTH7_9EUPU|nr:unnamed protein product [Candidula unifasciata]
MSETQLKIPYASIENHIQCSICLAVIRGAILTHCGHRYCNRCITEWVERHHRCPCCNSNLTTQQFHYDVQFDSLVEDILTERDKAEQAYFDKMQNSEASPCLSSFEEILKKHMKSSLMSHKRYFDLLRDECERKINLLNGGINTLPEGHNVSGTDNCDNIDNLKDAMRNNLEESERLASEAFDRYLTEHVPSIEILPVTVSVYLADKNIRLPDVVFKPSDSLDVLKPIVENAMLAKTDKIVAWTDEGGTKLLFGPLSKTGTYDIAEVSSNIDTLPDVHQLTWNTRPIFQHHMQPGSEIVLQGVFKAESDLPQRCFANTFHENGSQPTDYFLCYKCNVKWICKSCIQCCHTGHNIAPFVLRHKPTWACCYCPKKQLCKIQNK